MSCNQNDPKSCFDEKARMTDLLSSQKYITSIYNSNLLESATSEVKRCLSVILNDEHSIQEEIFTEMNTRGWYNVEKAEEAKLNQTKQQYGAKVSV